MPMIMTNSVFFHIPKAGGTWVSKVLEEFGAEANHPYKKHKYGLDRQHTIPEDFPTDKKTYCFVRHPVTWYQSYWRYKTKGISGFRGQDWKPEETEIDGCKDLQFNNFVNNVLDKYPEGYLSTIYPLFTENVDKVGKVEHLWYHLYEFLTGFGEEFNYRKLFERSKLLVNTSITSAEAIYDKDTLERVLKVERKVIKKYYEI